MVNIELVPDEADVVRLCRTTHIDQGRPTGAAFAKRADESDLSVNWLEKADGHSEDEKLRSTIGLFQLEVRPSYSLALLLVGHIRNIAAMPALDVLHQPLAQNDAHCGIINVPENKPGSLNSVSMALAAAVRRCVTRAVLDAGAP